MPNELIPMSTWTPKDGQTYEIVDQDARDRITAIEEGGGGGGGGSGTVKSVNSIEPDANGNVTLEIPSKTSDLQNDSGYLTQHQSLAAYRTSAAQDIIDAAQDQAIAAKYTKPSGGIPTNDLDPVGLRAWLDDTGANIITLSLSGTTVTLDMSFLVAYNILTNSARQTLFVLPIGGTAQQLIVLELYPVHADAQSYTITLACVYNGNRYSVALSAASINASQMTGTLVTEPIVTQTWVGQQDYQTAQQVQTAIAQSGGGLPDTTSASAGDFLRLNAQKNAVWETVPTVEGASIPLGN